MNQQGFWTLLIWVDDETIKTWDGDGPPSPYIGCFWSNGYTLTIKFNSMFVFLGGYLWRCFSSWLPNWILQLLPAISIKSTWIQFFWNKNYIFKVEMAIPKFQIEFWTATPPHPCSWTATRVSHMHGCLRHTFAPSLSPPKNISRNPKAKSCDPDLWILMLTYGYLWGISMGYAAFIHFQVWPDCDDWHSEHDASTISAST